MAFYLSLDILLCNSQCTFNDIFDAISILLLKPKYLIQIKCAERNELWGYTDCLFDPYIIWAPWSLFPVVAAAQLNSRCEYIINLFFACFQRPIGTTRSSIQ